MASLAWPRAGHWNRALVNSSTGALFKSTSYYVYLSDGSTQATIYTDATKASTLSQPLTTDSAGNAGFYTDPYSGLIISVSGVTEVIDVFPDVADMGYNFFSDGGINTTYTASGADNVKALGFLAGTSAQNLTFNIPNNLPKNWSCDVWHEGGPGGTGIITFQAASGASIYALGVTSTSTIHHPGFAGVCSLVCRYNGSGTQASVFITAGVT